MMAITHAAIATAGASLLLGTSAPLPLALAVLGSQLPDIDTTTSIIGQVFYPVSSWIEDRYPHRSITHSLIATVAIATVSLAVGAALGDIKPWLALPLGHVLSCFADCFTRQGVQLFWPDPAWSISVSNPKRRLRTGGPAEYWVLSAAVALLLLGIWLASAGGVTGQVNQGLGLRDGAIATYNQNAATNEVYANVSGVWANDRTDATGTYLILDVQGSDFILTDGQGIYQTGKQIIVEKLTTKAGQTTQRTTTTLNFNDQDLAAALADLAAANPGKRIYLSGTIAIDFPEDVRPVTSDKGMVTLSVSGESATLNYHPLELAIAQFNDQWATGTLTALILTESK